MSALDVEDGSFTYDEDDIDLSQDGLLAFDRKSLKDFTLKSRFHFEKHMQTDVDQLVAGSLESRIVWDRLAEMTDTYGPRIVGSEALEKSLDWVLGKLKDDKLNFTTEDVIVDNWQRNHESLHFLSPTRGSVKLHMLGLGGSLGTPDPVNGLEAEVIAVHSVEELKELGEAGLVKGRVVLWNKPFESYDNESAIRVWGALWSQKYGAVAALIRSLGPFSLQSPHTGGMDEAEIPGASITAEDGDLLERSLKRHQQDPEQFPYWPKVKLIMGATMELDAKISRNIIIELKGREKPEEIVVIGGHSDSWDVGSGAVDDGVGCFIAWETIRQLSKLERPPRRTVRAVLWTSEEVKISAGGVTYAKNHPETNTSRHVFAFESDTGVFDPYGITFTPGRKGDQVQEESFEYLTAAGKYFMGSRKDLGYPGAGQYVLPVGHGADIEPLCDRGVACAHFTPADPFPLPYSTSPYAIPNHGRDKNKEEVKRQPHHRYHHPKHPRHRHNHRHGKHEIVDQPRRPIDNGYFYYHHTEADTMSAFTPDQVKRSAAVMAIWTYIAAEGDVEL
ncbi:hypothetical protein BGZ83_004570 [Gryganskiella cystojenkinii]|nr:hypothetical protein BGZ83_004570 [Gryganskiella cystojenkinii]